MSVAAPASPLSGWLSRPASWPQRAVTFERRARERRRRNVIIGSVLGVVALILIGAYVYFFTPLIQGAIGPSTRPVQVSRAVLEALPEGTGLAFVMRDETGADAVFTGNLVVSLREPDGAQFQTTRSVVPANFHVLPAGTLLAGRLGYTLVIPPNAWNVQPRRGRPALIELVITLADPTAPTISYTGNESFP